MSTWQSILNIPSLLLSIDSRLAEIISILDQRLPKITRRVDFVFIPNTVTGVKIVDNKPVVDFVDSAGQSHTGIAWDVFVCHATPRMLTHAKEILKWRS